MMADDKLNELKKKLETELFNIEKKIYDMETYYLEETASSGNDRRFNLIPREHYQRLGRLS